MEVNSEKIAYFSSGGATLLGFGINEWVSLVGIGCAIVTTLVNWFYKHKGHKLAESKGRKGDCP